MAVWKMAASIAGGHLQLKDQLWLAEPMAILVEAFASYLKCAIPQRHLWDRPWMQIDNKQKSVVGLTLRYTLNAAGLISFLDMLFW